MFHKYGIKPAGRSETLLAQIQSITEKVHQAATSFLFLTLKRTHQTPQSISIHEVNITAVVAAECCFVRLNMRFSISIKGILS